jgi:hypothetical protein
MPQPVPVLGMSPLSTTSLLKFERGLSATYPRNLDKDNRHTSLPAFQRSNGALTFVDIRLVGIASLES